MSEALELPINQITPYVPHWVIKAKILNKTVLRHTPKNISFFETVLIDNAGDVILAKYWDKSAEKWFPIVEQNKVYTFSSGNVDVANKHFNNLPHPYELKFFESSRIELSRDDFKITAQRNLTYTNLRSVFTSKKNLPFTVNLLVAVVNVEPTRTLKKRDGSEILLKKILVVDDSDFEFSLLLWSEEAKNPIYNDIEGKIVSFSEVRVTDKNEEGKTGTIGSLSQVLIAPENNPRTSELKQWFKLRDRSQNFASMRTNPQGENNFYTNPLQLNISSIKKDSESTMGRYITTARLVKVHWKKKTGEESLVYPACNKCNRKVIFDSYGESYSCEPCGETTTTPAWRYMLAISIMDHTGIITLKTFDNAGAALLDVSAEDINSWDPSRKQSYLENEMTHKLFEFSIRSRPDTYNSERKVVYQLQNVSPIEFSQITSNMIETINNWLSTPSEENPKRPKMETSNLENSSIEINT